MTLPPEVVVELFRLFTPLVRRAIEARRGGGAEPTDAEVVAEFRAHVDAYLAEGEAWRAAHPE